MVKVSGRKKKPTSTGLYDRDRAMYWSGASLLPLAVALTFSRAYGSDSSAYCPELSQQMEVYRCKCYRFVTTEMFWTNARDNCMESNGQLVQVLDAATNAWLGRQLDRKFYSKNGVWIGLHYVNAHRDWSWTSGMNMTAVGYSNWADKEPDRQGLLGILNNADCAIAWQKDQWRWRAKLCLWKTYPFVCQYAFRDGAPCAETDAATGELSIEAIIGISVGAIVGVILLSLLLCWVLCLLRSAACDRLKLRGQRREARRPPVSDGATVSYRSARSAPATSALTPAASRAPRNDNDLNEQAAAVQRPLLLSGHAPPNGSVAKPPVLNVDLAGDTACDVDLAPLRQQGSVKITNDGSRYASSAVQRLAAGDQRVEIERRHSSGSREGVEAAGGDTVQLRRTVSIEDNVLAANANLPDEKEHFTRSLNNLEKYDE